MKIHSTTVKQWFFHLKKKSETLEIVLVFNANLISHFFSSTFIHFQKNKQNKNTVQIEEAAEKYLKWNNSMDRDCFNAVDITAPFFSYTSFALSPLLPPRHATPPPTALLGKKRYRSRWSVFVITTRPSCSVYYHGNEEPHLEKIGKNFINCHHGNLSISCIRVRIVVNLFFFSF